MLIDGFEKSATLNRQFLLLKEKRDTAYDYFEHWISIKGSSHKLICIPELWYLEKKKIFKHLSSTKKEQP